jgi:hypothetical protein
MPFKMSEFQSIDPGHVAKLHELGIETTDDMLRRWRESDRTSLAEKAGVSKEEFSKWLGLSRLSRVGSLGLKHVELLVASGVDGPRSLGEHTPESLVALLNETIAERNLPASAPTLDEVATWQADLKPVSAGAR